MLFFTCDGRRKAEESGNHFVLYFSAAAAAAAASFLLSLCFSILFPSCVGVVVWKGESDYKSGERERDGEEDDPMLKGEDLREYM